MPPSDALKFKLHVVSGFFADRGPTPAYKDAAQKRKPSSQLRSQPRGDDALRVGGMVHRNLKFPLPPGEQLNLA